MVRMLTVSELERTRNHMQCNWDTYTAFQGMSYEEACDDIDGILELHASAYEWAKRLGTLTVR